MAVGAVVLDLDGTLLDSSGAPATGIREMLSALSGAEFKIAVASNRPGAARKLGRASIVPDLILDHAFVGSNKGTNAWVEKACEYFGIGRDQLVWLGDSDLDMRSAVNQKVAYFNAGWSTPDYPYGIQLSDPGLFPAIIEECFAKSPEWFAELDTLDGDGQPVHVRAVMDTRGGGDQLLENHLLQFLKQRHDFSLGSLMFGDFVAFHLFGSLYSSGLVQATNSADVWTVYPGSTVSKGPNASLAPFVRQAARLFRSNYVGDLLIRHTDALDSGATRFVGGQVSFSNQVNTINVNPSRSSKISGKRIFVIDDFETDGNSAECARILLLRAGASEVISVSIAKYPMRGRGYVRYVWTPMRGHDWDPYLPHRHSEDDFDGVVTEVRTNQSAPVSFLRSFKRMSQL